MSETVAPREWARRWILSARITYRGRGNKRAVVDLPPLSPLGENVADVLHSVYGGIYNAPCRWEKVEWHNPRYIRVPVYGGLYSFDNNRLTTLLFRCHDLALRVEIVGANRRYLALVFHPRKHRSELSPAESRIGVWAYRHPTLEEAVTEYRKHYPAPDVDR